MSITRPDSNHIALTLPWTLQPDSETDAGDIQIALSAVSSATGNSITADISLLQRRYLTHEIQDTDTAAVSLYLRYIAANSTDGVLRADNVLLADLPEGFEACLVRPSPSGQYVAYSVRKLDGFPPFDPCLGIYLIDVDLQQSVKVSKLDGAGEESAINELSWSPDGEKLFYNSDAGSGIAQNYVYNLTDDTTSYINYGNNDLANNDAWPSELLYPLEDGGNPWQLDLVENPVTFMFTWMTDSTGLVFSVYDNEAEDFRPYLGSVLGDARELTRGSFILEQAMSLDEEAQQEYFDLLQECPEGGICAAPILYNLFNVNNNHLRNPWWYSYSPSGQLAFISNLYANTGVPADNVLVAHIPVVAGENPLVDNSPIEALDVYDAAWSPVANDLAFASSYGLRHAHPADGLEDSTTFNQLVGYEQGGQLYYYPDYQQGHTLPQERLVNPVPTIDDNDVRALKWAASGQQIAYIRGEDSSEGYFYTSPWVVTLDDVRDESETTIEANNTLLVNYRSDDHYPDYLTRVRA